MCLRQPLPNPFPNSSRHQLSLSMSLSLVPLLSPVRRFIDDVETRYFIIFLVYTTRAPNLARVQVDLISWPNPTVTHVCHTDLVIPTRNKDKKKFQEM